MRARRWLLRSRRRTAILYLAAVGVAIYAITIPLSWGLAEFLGFEKVDWGIPSLLITLFVVALHALFLWPIARPGAGPSRGLTASALAAAFMVGVLVSAGVGALSFLIYEETGLDIGVKPMTWVLIAALLAGWVIATPLVLAFIRKGRRETMLARLAARLFTGTIIEAAAIIPIDVLIRRKEDCVCTTGTYFALVACGGVGIFALGPVIVLPVLARRRKRWYASHCDVCGYDMSTTLKLDRCPECGTGWR